MILGLDNELKEEDFGGKAAGLSTLIRFGVKVPSGFAISCRVQEEFLSGGSMESSVRNAIEGALMQLRSDLVIVRSSAVGEDGTSHSFAGQLDSFVVENEVNSVIDRVKECWSGLQNDRLLAYSRLTGKHLSEMGVIVQEFIEPDFAGVLFTKSPFSTNEGKGGNNIYAEYVSGRGELLVSGAITPSTLDSKNLEMSPFPADDLFTGAIDLKAKYGHDLDIEWVSKEGLIYFVQARPITVEVVDRTHWSSTNLNENYPDPISPLLYSIARDSYYHYFKNLAVLLQLNPQSIRELEYDFSNAVGSWGNRIYYNMTSIHNILSSSPLKSYFIDAFNNFIGYKDKDVSSEDRSSTVSLFKMIWRLLRLNFSLEKKVLQIEEMVDNFSEEERSESRNDKELFYTFLDLRFHQWHRASLADFFAMIHYKLLGVFTRKFYGAESIGVHNKLIQAIPGLMSTRPLEDIYDISIEIKASRELSDLFSAEGPKTIWKRLSEEDRFADLKVQIDKYLVKWGFRCSGELMFFKTNYIDAPYQFIELLQSYLKNEAQDPRLAISEKAKEREKAVSSFMRKIIKKRHILVPVWLVEVAILKLLIRLCSQAISGRERVRYKQAEMYYRFKSIVRRIGIDKGINDEVFYLTYKEIGELVSTSSMFQGQVGELVGGRKEYFNAASEKIFPEHFTTKVGERPDFVAEDIDLKADNDVFSGLAASGGRLQGRVKVLESVLESEKLQKGDILVTKQTDPGWAMVFPIIAGLIVEKGGALSHGAIVAREFGIPAVVGIRDITKHLKDGDEVILDGDLGKIQVLR